MKICILTEYLSYVGGGERVYCNWANMFSRLLCHEVTIASMEDGEKPYYELVPEVKVHSLHLRSTGYYKDPGKRRKGMIVHFLSDRKKIRKYLEKNNFDVVLGVATNMNIILASIRYRGVRIGTEHTEYFAAGKPIRMIRKWLYRKFDAVTVLNYEDERLFRKLNPHTFTMLNPVQMKSGEVSDLTNKKLISIGSLSPQKNQKQMLDVMRLVVERHPDWTLTIYGEGPLRKELEAYAEAIGVSPFVKIPGIVSDPVSVLRESSVFLLTSNIEGFGLVLVEAMAAGLPCVSTESLGPKMIIQEGENGFLVPQNNPEAFADKVCRLIEQPVLRRQIGRKGLESTRKYRMENIAKDWQRLFDRLLPLI